MLKFRSVTVVLLWSSVLLGSAIPASGQCELKEVTKLSASPQCHESTLPSRLSSVSHRA